MTKWRWPPNSQQDCKLDCLLDGIEEEVFESKWLCTFLTMWNSSWIIYHLSWQTFSLQPPDPRVRSVSEYPRGRIDRGMPRKLGVGVIVAWTDKLYSASYLILHWDRKKHLLERIVPLRVPFPGCACIECTCPNCDASTTVCITSGGAKWSEFGKHL